MTNVIQLDELADPELGAVRGDETRLNDTEIRHRLAETQDTHVAFRDQVEETILKLDQIRCETKWKINQSINQSINTYI